MKPAELLKILSGYKHAGSELTYLDDVANAALPLSLSTPDGGDGK